MYTHDLTMYTHQLVWKIFPSHQQFPCAQYSEFPSLKGKHLCWCVFFYVVSIVSGLNINGTTRSTYAIFSANFLLFSVKSIPFIHVVMCISSLFFISPFLSGTSIYLLLLFLFFRHDWVTELLLSPFLCSKIPRFIAFSLFPELCSAILRVGAVCWWQILGWPLL